MRKILLVLGFTALTGSAFSQATFGVHGNLIGASMKEEYDGEEGFDLKTRFSYKAGVVADFALSDNIRFMPQLNILSKGAKVDVSESESFLGIEYSFTAKGNIKTTYLELPLNFVYQHELASGNSVFFGIGPSLSYGLSGDGKIDVTETEDGETISYTEEGKIKFDGDKDANDEDLHYKAFEFGGSVIGGYRFSNGLFINAHYNLGLSNINVYDDGKTNNRYFGIGIGYFFGGVGSAKK